MKKNLLLRQFIVLITLMFLAFTRTQAQATLIKESNIVRETEDAAPTNNWVGYFRLGTPSSALTFISGPLTPPLGCGSVQLSTQTGSEKLQLFNFDHVGKKLSDINAISYSTFRVTASPSTPSAVASLNILIDPDGPLGPAVFSTLVFEPIYTVAQGPIINGTWQTWNAKAGLWWSTKPINGQPAGAAVADMRTWAQIVANNPNATILGGVGLNQGSGNGGLVTAVDNFSFDNSVYNFEQVSNPVTNVNTGRTYCTIQSAIDDPLTLNGHVINIDAGVYPENVNVTKWLTLNGAGNSTVIQPAVPGPGITMNSPGLNSAQRAVVKNLKITGALGGGNIGSGLSIFSGQGYLTFQNVSAVSNSGSGLGINHTGALTDIVVDGCDLSGNGNDGFRIPTSLIGLDGLTITNSHMDGNGTAFAPNSGSGIGLDIFSAQVAHPDPSVVDAFRLVNNVSILGCTFNNNLTKGIYTERLNNALISNCIVSQSGVIGTVSPAGIDLNLKFNAFRNITLDNISVLNSAPNLAGIYAKARNDGGTYGPRPASLTDLLITNSEVTGSKYGIIVENNISDVLAPGDQTQIHFNKIYNNSTAGLVNNIDGNKLVNAECNWWGAVSGPLAVSNPAGTGNPVVNNVDYTPWLLDPNSKNCGGGIPKLSTSINGVIVNANNDGSDDLGVFAVCNAANNLLFNSFTDQNGLSNPNLKVYQTIATSNVSVPFCNNCSASMAAFTNLPATASLINPLVPGTLTMRFRSWVDSNNDGIVDPAEASSDWIQYTVTVNPEPTFSFDITGSSVHNINNGTADPSESATVAVCDGGTYTVSNLVHSNPANRYNIAVTTSGGGLLFNGGVAGNGDISAAQFNGAQQSYIITLANPAMGGSLVQVITPYNDVNNSGSFDAGDCTGDPIIITYTADPRPALQTTVNGITLTNNHDGADETATLKVCNTGNNLHFTQFVDAVNVSPSSLVKVIQQFTRINTSFGPADGTFPISAFSGSTPFDRTVSLVNPSMSGTLIMRFQTFYDANNNNILDADECANDWLQYTVYVDGEPPVLSVPVNTTIQCSDPIPAVGSASAVDDLDQAPVVTYGGEVRTNGNCPNNYILTRTWTATDNCGNTSTGSQVITVSDTQAPALTGAPYAGTTGTNACMSAAATAAPFDAANAMSGYSDNCSGTVSATLTGTNTTGTNCAWTVTYTFDVTDACGNTLHNQTYHNTGSDQTPPVVSCPPAPAAVQCGGAIPTPYSSVSAFINAGGTVSDNCSTANMTISSVDVVNGDASTNNYSITRTYTIKDACGNAATCMQTITINDQTPPVITCNNSITVSNDANRCGAVVCYPMPVATDNCRPATPAGYTYKAQYGNSYYYQANSITNYATAKANAIAAGGHLAIITSAAENAAVAAGGAGFAYMDGTDAGHEGIFIYSDCSTATFLPWCGSEPGGGTSENNLEFETGGCWNDIGANNPRRGLLEIEGARITQTAGLPSGSMFPVGSTINTFVATDAAGLTSACSFTVTVNDNQKPTINCAADQTKTNDAGACGANVTVVAPTAADNCAVASVMNDHNNSANASGFYPVGTTLVTWTVTDVNNNTMTCHQNITVTDNEKPQLLGVPANTTVECSAVPQPATVTATDNCPDVSAVSFNETRTNGSCPNSYTLTRTWSVTDAHSNTQTATQVINVVDNTAPVLTVPADISVECSSVPAPGTATATDNCDGSPVVTYQGQTTAPSTSSTTAFTGTRTNGNQNYGERLGMVFNANASITVTQLGAYDDGQNGLSLPITVGIVRNSDGVTVAGPITMSGTSDPLVGNYRMRNIAPVTLPAGQYIIVAVGYGNAEMNGNSNNGGSSPAFHSGNGLLSSLSSPYGGVGFGKPTTPFPTPGIFHAGTFTIATVACANNYTITRTWKATDACLNSTTGSQTIFVSDHTAPQLMGTIPSGGSNMNLCYSNIPAGPTEAQIAALYTDNCGAVHVVKTGTPTGNNCNWSVTYHYTITDDCGNWATPVDITYSGGDTQAPTFTRPIDKIIPFTSTCGYDVSVANTGDVTNEADNCSTGLNATYTDVVTQCGSGVIIKRTWSLVDNCGNAAANQVQTITVTDNNTPYIIYATDEVHFGENNSIGGDVGVTAANGKAEFKKNDVLDNYTVRAKNISTQAPSAVNNKVFSPATGGPNPTFYPFTGDTHGLPDYTVSVSTAVPISANYKNLTIKKNVVCTVTGTLYGHLTIEEGAQVTFNPSGGVLNVEEFNAKGKKEVVTREIFSTCTSVRISKHVELNDNNQFNVNGPKVTVYCGDDNKDGENFHVKGKGSMVTANIYIPIGDLHVDGSDDDTPTMMTGWFIAQKVHSDGKNVTWNKYGCIPPAFAANTGVTDEPTAKAVVPATPVFDVLVSPNPSRYDFRMQVIGSDNSPVTVRITDMSGRVISARPEIAKGSVLSVGSELKAGSYFAEIIQGNNRKVVKLIKLD